MCYHNNLLIFNFPLIHFIENLKILKMFKSLLCFFVQLNISVKKVHLDLELRQFKQHYVVTKGAPSLRLSAGLHSDHVLPAGVAGQTAVLLRDRLQPHPG